MRSVLSFLSFPVDSSLTFRTPFGTTRSRAMATFQPEKQQSSSVSPQRPRSVTWRGLFCSSIYLIAWIFLVLVLVGNVADKPGLRDTWFLKLDLSKIIPLSIPDAPLINSIAQSIGLHDFYQVGVWNFCEGYDDTGITHCSKPKPLYWFDPVEIIMSELLAGASSMCIHSFF